jgi:hypothetical protein
MDAVRLALGVDGFALLGAFHPVAQDNVPSLSDGASAGSVLMIGSAGPAMFEQFSFDRAATDVDGSYRSHRPRPDRSRPDRSRFHQYAGHPLDEWTKAKLQPVAARFSGEVLFPSDGPPWQPFQRWASLAAPFYRSPLGLYIHPEFGVWCGLRAALLLRGSVEHKPQVAAESPCSSCAAKPCLHSCPVQAFDGDSFDAPACRRHLESDPDGDCATRGCRARRACPIGVAYHQAPAQASFHMAAFRRSLGD